MTSGKVRIFHRVPFKIVLDAATYEISKKYYLKSLQLNPKNENARKMLSKIEKQTITNPN